MATVEQAIGRGRVRKALKRYEPKPTDRHAQGLVRAIHDDGAFEVLLPGAVETTRCGNYCSAMVGDIVAVVIRSDGSCAAIGRLGGDIGGGTAVVTYDDASNWIAGRVFAYAGTDEPIGCLPCDGRAVSRTVYWELFNAIGTTYGSGDGSSTFNLPNLESRTIIGEGTGASGTEYALGATGGEEKHAQTVDELAPHDHRYTRSSNVSDWPSIIPMGGGVGTGDGTAIEMAGGGQPFNVMQPYIVMRYFITTGKGDPASGINPADYVAEWGTTGIWTWRKYASGLAECWGSQQFSPSASAWQGHYMNATSVALPFEFKEILDARAEVTANGSNIVFGSVGSVSNTEIRYYHSSMNDVISGTSRLYVLGKWKDSPASGGTESITPTIESRFQALESMLEMETVEVASYASGWTAYSGGLPPTLKRCGKVVTLTGYMTPTADVYLGVAEVVMLTIPEKYAPAKALHIVCQGSQINRWLLIVNPDGSITASRYGTTANSTVTAGSWFPFHATWIID